MLQNQNVTGATPRPTTVGPLAMPKAVLFDLDGTLIDTMGAFADVAADVMVTHHGLDRGAARAAYLRTSGIPFFKQLEVIAPDDPRNAAAAEVFEARKVLAVEHVRMDDATVQALRHMQRVGMRLAVCSNNFQAQVDQFIVDSPVRFDLALGFGEGLAKGESHFALVCKTFGLERTDVLFVGDSLADAALAQASSVRFVARLGTFSAHQFADAYPKAPAVSSLGQLVELFG